MQKDTEKLEAIERFNTAIDLLEEAFETRLERELKLNQADAVVQRISNDRAQLAQQLDDAYAKIKKLEDTNRAVSQRITNIIEMLRPFLQSRGIFK